MTKLNKRVVTLISAAVLAISVPPSAALANNNEDAVQQIDSGNILLQEDQDNSGLEQEIDAGNILMFSGAPENIGDESYEGEGEQQPEPTGADATQNPDQPDATGEGEDPYLDPEYTGEPEGEGGEEGEQPEEPSTQTANVVGSDVKIRTEPNTDSEDNIVFRLSNGMEVEILGQEGDWHKIRFGIVEGYVYSQYLFINNDDGRNGVIVEDGVNLRAGASTETEALSQMEVGFVVKVLGYEDGWYKVEYNEQTGYIHRNYIEVTGKYTGQNVRAIREGMSGSEVNKIQEALKQRGFFIGETTEDYGEKTKSAIKDFQKAANVDADGIAGQATLDLLYDDNNNIVKAIADKEQVRGLVQLTEWNDVNKIIARGETFKVIDVETGISWTERRMGGWYHIDTEPLTAEDSRKMKKAYGGTWSWDRRAVWVVYGDKVFAASMNGMPHLGSTIGNNNFNGHHCIHFYKSKVHANSKQCPRHQAKVQEAYAQGN